MIELKLFVWRRRKMLLQLGALLTLGLGALIIVTPTPRADATEQVKTARLPDAMSLLLSPAPLSSERFLAYYAIAYR